MSVSDIDYINGLELIIDVLLEQAEILESHLPEIPDANCSCHLSPPCNDCFEWAALREAIESISAIKKEWSP
jgi:hypothetical protein